MKKIILAIMCLIMSAKLADASLLINEFYASPASGDDEWLELYNPTDEIISLRNWQIAEINGTVMRYAETVDPLNEASIGAKAFYTIIPQGKLTLNNSGDTIYLLRPDGSVAQEITYPKLTSKQVYARVPDGSGTWEVSSYISPGKSNVEPTPDTSDEIRDLTSNNTDTTTNNNSSTGTTSTTVSTSTTGVSTGATPTLTTTTSSNSSSSSTTSKTTTSSSTSSTTASSTPTTSTTTSTSTTEDTSWQDGIEFRAPKLTYTKTSNSKAVTPVPQVLGMATKAASESAVQTVTPVRVNWLVIFLSVAGIIAGMIAIVVVESACWWQQRGVSNEKSEEF